MPDQTEHASRQKAINDLTVYGTGMAASAVYALLLDKIERKMPVNPDGTILEVMGGVTLTMTVALARIFVADRIEKRQSSAYDGWTTAAQSFMITSLPISIWQILRMIERHTWFQKQASVWSVNPAGSDRRVSDQADHVST
jgi:hypothetical protein